MSTTLSPSTPLCSLIRSAGFALSFAVLVTACDVVDEDSPVAMELALDDGTAYSISPQAGEPGDGVEIGELPAQIKAPDGPIYPLVGNAWFRGWTESTDNEGGLTLDSSSIMSCFLSGIAGDLNHGQRSGFGGGVLSRPSIARVYDPYDVPGDDYHLVAHGGATQNQTNQQEWFGNLVRAQATCFFTTVGQQWEGMWEGGGPKKIAPLSDSLLYARQCFLTGIIGVDETYDSSRYARVVKRTLIDATHPTTGWYIESDLPADSSHGSRPAVFAGCVDFPANTVFSSDSLSADEGHAQSSYITWGTGLKACALTGIVGAFNVDDRSNGVLMTHPSEPDGDWIVEVSDGKAAAWTCAK